MAVFDILLRALEEVKSEPFLLDCTGGGMYPAPEVGYADDLISLMGSLLGLQDKADMVSACSQLLGLTIASPKLRVFRADWTSGSLSITPEDGVLVVHGTRWTPEEVPVQVDGAVKALGVHYDLALTGQTQLDLSTSELRQLLAASRYKPASPDTLKVVVESCLVNKVAYRGVLSGWSLQQTMSLDKHLAAEYRRRTLNNRTYQEESLFQPAEAGGLGFRRLSSAIQYRKKALWIASGTRPA